MLNHCYITSIVLSFFISIQTTYGQKTVKQDILYGWKLSERSLLQPLHNKSKTALTIGAVAVGTGIVITQDDFLNDIFLANPNSTKDFLAAYVGEPFGNPIFHIALVGGTYLGSKIFENEALADKSVRTLTALTFSGVTVQIFKHAFARARPYTGEDQYQFFDEYFSGANYLSFPSGHTIMAFTFASSVTHLFPEQYWIPLVAYPLATITAWSRMYDNKHWASDVLVGAIIGHLIGKSMAEQEDVKIGFSANPYGGFGFNATVSF